MCLTQAHAVGLTATCMCVSTLTRADVAVLIEARAALGLPSVHCLLSSAICYPIINPEQRARQTRGNKSSDTV